MTTMISGNGPKIVLIHGWAANARLMATLAAELDGRFECHCIDLPGHGHNATGRVDIGLEDAISHVEKYVRNLGEPVILLGWAMGALIGLAVASRIQVRGLICIGTPSGGAELGPAFEKMAGRLVRDWPRYVRSSVDVIVGDRVSPEMHSFLCSTMERTAPSLARRMLLEVAQADPLSYAGKVLSPLLLLHGEDDKISPVAIAKSLHGIRPEAQIKIYPNVGHAPFLEHREQTLSDINVFLETLND